MPQNIKLINKYMNSNFRSIFFSTIWFKLVATENIDMISYKTNTKKWYINRNSITILNLYKIYLVYRFWNFFEVMITFIGLYSMYMEHRRRPINNPDNYVSDATENDQSSVRVSRKPIHLGLWAYGCTRPATSLSRALRKSNIWFHN